MIKRILYTLLIMFPVVASAQINTDRVMAIGRNALYFEDYVLSIQYFNQVINAKPYLSDPYFYRGLAKINLDDFQGAESDCSEAIERNPFVVSAYQVRGLARIQQNNFAGAIEDYTKALEFDPENIGVWQTFHAGRSFPVSVHRYILSSPDSLHSLRSHCSPVVPIRQLEIHVTERNNSCSSETRKDGKTYLSSGSFHNIHG